MLAYRKRSSNDPDLVGRIDSGHLSEQFQRDLSSSPGDDLLQNDLKLDDISNASGSGVAALAATPQPKQVLKPELLATMDVADDNWLVATPLASPTPTQDIRQNQFHDPERQPDNRGGSTLDPATITKLERSTSKALTQAYAQPSKIPRLSQANTTARPLQRQPSKGLGKRLDTTAAHPITRSRSGAGRDIKATSPAPSQSNMGVKPAFASPSRSVSDSGEDGPPEWRAVSKPPAPKYTQQTDIALGGPFERSSSSQLPRANSTQKGRPRSRPTSHYTSQPTSHPTSRPTLHPTTAKTAAPMQAELRTESSIPQSKIPVAPFRAADASSVAEAAEPSISGAEHSRGASSFAQEGIQQEQLAVTDQPMLQQPATMPVGAHPPKSIDTAEPHLNGMDQHVMVDSMPQGDPSKVQEALRQDQQPVSLDQVQVALPGPQTQGQSAIKSHNQHRSGSAQADLEQQQVEKAKKCCCCVIM